MEADRGFQSERNYRLVNRKSAGSRFQMSSRENKCIFTVYDTEEGDLRKLPGDVMKIHFSLMLTNILSDGVFLPVYHYGKLLDCFPLIAILGTGRI